MTTKRVLRIAGFGLLFIVGVGVLGANCDLAGSGLVFSTFTGTSVVFPGLFGNTPVVPAISPIPPVDTVTPSGTVVPIVPLVPTDVFVPLADVPGPFPL